MGLGVMPHASGVFYLGIGSRHANLYIPTSLGASFTRCVRVCACSVSWQPATQLAGNTPCSYYGVILIILLVIIVSASQVAALATAVGPSTSTVITGYYYEGANRNTSSPYGVISARSKNYLLIAVVSVAGSCLVPTSDNSRP